MDVENEITEIKTELEALKGMVYSIMEEKIDSCNYCEGCDDCGGYSTEEDLALEEMLNNRMPEEQAIELEPPVA
jgi:hypothetical protein